MVESALTPELAARLRKALADRAGVDLSYYTESFLGRRLAVRLRHHGLDASRYVALLETDAEEAKAFAHGLTVSVTEFFRDQKTYDALRDKVFPVLFSGPPRRVQVWSAGCATGEEPYALAMLLDEALAPRKGWSYSILATDISPAQVAASTRGVYPAAEADKLPERFRRRHFAPAGEGQVTVGPALRAGIRFQVHDLSGGGAPPQTGFDLILCRNVMIYFAADAKDRVLELFHRAMAPEGFLVLGGSEVILKDRVFRPFDAHNKIYRAVPPGKGAP